VSPQRGEPRGSWQHLAFWENGRIALGATQAALVSNDQDAAAFIAAERGGGLNYAVASDTWHVWDGRCHRPDSSGKAGLAGLDYADRLRQMLDYARAWVTEDTDRRLAPGATEAARRQARTEAWAPWLASEKYAARLRSNAGQAALLGMLARACPRADEDLDERHPGLLSCANGTLDLATLALRQPRMADMITYCLDTRWNPAAECPRFWSLVWRMCGRDAEVAGYLVKLLGYALLGDNREQKVIFIAGPTGSGKSQVLRIVKEVLGPLAHNSGAELITVVRQGRNARKENSVRGRRFVTITETSQWMNIDEAQLKRLTGESEISVDQHYAKREIAARVTWTIFVATNEMPNLTNFDEAMRRRIIVIPAGESIPEFEVDPRLSDKILGSEREGILALLARGCQEYHRSQNLEMPWRVREMTELYAHQQDTVGSFLADCMVIGGWSVNGGVPQSDAWHLYQKWSDGSARLGRNTFMERLGAHPAVTWNKVTRRFEGVAWNPDWATKVLPANLCIGMTILARFLDSWLDS
jgi:P4 family phage/plasmid primase-like protien